MKTIFLILGIVFLFLVMVVHPVLVVDIIFQVETSFVTRIGRVIMTYPILFAVLLLSFKMFEKVGQKDNKKREEESNSTWGFIIGILVCLPLLIYFGIIAGAEFQLRHQRLQEGVSGVAIVQTCEKRKGSRRNTFCYMSYEYKVRLANNTTKLYRARERINCSRECHVGSSVDITYLPQTPSEAGIEGNTYGLKNSVFALTSSFNLLCLLLSERLWV